jgi:hypothetical protein
VKFFVLGLTIVITLLSMGVYVTGQTGSEIVLHPSFTEQFYGRWARTWDVDGQSGIVMTSIDSGYDSLNSPPIGTTNNLQYRFWARSATRYRLWLRLKAANNSKWNDSVWVQFDRAVDKSGNSIYRTGSSSALLVNLENCFGCGTSGWGWQNRAWWLNDTGEIWFEQDGWQTISIWIREDGVSLESIVLSAARYVDSPPGPVRNADSRVAVSWDERSPASPPNVVSPFLGAQAIPPEDGANALFVSSGPCVRQDVYLGTSNPPPLVAASQSCGVYQLPALQPATTYYWRIDAYGYQGVTPGQTGYFTTRGAPPGNIVLYPSDLDWRWLHEPWMLAADPTGTVVNSWKSARVLRTEDRGWSSVDMPPIPSATNWINIPFMAEADVPYHLWLRMKAQNNSKWNDSLWVQFSNASIGGSPAYKIDSSNALLVNLEDCYGCGHDEWGWQDSSWWLNQSATVTFTTPFQVLRLIVREDGVSVDQIVLSPSEFLHQPPGPPKGDRTVVPKP